MQLPVCAKPLLIIANFINRTKIVFFFLIIFCDVFYFINHSNDMVTISMDTFVRRFQPDRYDDWINGTDYGPHPEDPPQSALKAAPLPSHKDILVNKK